MLEAKRNSDAQQSKKAEETAAIAERDHLAAQFAERVPLIIAELITLFRAVTDKAKRDIEAAIAAPAPNPRAGPADKPGPKPKPGPSGADQAGEAAREAERAARAAAAFANELEQLNADELQAKADLSDAIRDRLAAELARINADANAFAREVALDGELTATQREMLLLERGQVDILCRQRAEQAAQLAELEKSKRLSDADNAAQQDRLRAELALTDGRQERAQIENRLLSLQQEQERADLELTVATLELAGVKTEELRIAKARLARLDTVQTLEQQALDRQNESPGQRYVGALNATSGQINDALEGIQIDGLEALNDGLVDAILGAKSLGDVFENVADQIIKDLLRIAIQRALIEPLANAPFGGAGGGVGGIGASVGGFIGGLFGGGRASGGYVAPGQIYRINEGASPGRVEGFQPNGGGNIIPLGRMNAIPRSQPGGGGTASVRLELSGDIDARIERVSGPVAVEVVRGAAPLIVDAAANETFARSARPTI